MQETTAVKRPITKKYIAEKLNVSRTLVSYVLNNTPNVKVSPVTRRRICELAKELNYVPTPARNRPVGTPMIALLQLGRRLDDPIYMDFLSAMEQRIAADHQHMIFMSVNTTESDYDRALSRLESNLLRGVILVGDVRKKMIDLLERHRIPFVVYGETDDVHNARQVSYVSIDTEQMAYDATRFLFEKGRRHVAIITGCLSLRTHRLWIEGYKRAHREAGVAINEGLIQVTELNQDALTAKRLIRLGLKFDGLVAVNDMVGVAAMGAFTDEGLKIPDDVAVIGSGNLEVGRRYHPSLSTFDAPVDRTAKLLFETLIRHINNFESLSEHLSVRHQLIERESTAV